MNLIAFPDLDMQAYAGFRNELRTGDLLFASGQRAFSRMVQQASQCCWDHVALIWRLEPFDRLMVLESHEHHGVRVLPLSRFVRSYEGGTRGFEGRLAVARHRRFAECASSDALRQMADYAWSALGQPASRERSEVLIARVFSPALHLHCRPEAGELCWLSAEFVAGCYQCLGLHLQVDPQEQPVTPAAFAQDPNLLWLCELEVEQEWRGRGTTTD
jgi:hypothetical protein